MSLMYRFNRSHHHLSGSCSHRARCSCGSSVWPSSRFGAFASPSFSSAFPLRAAVFLSLFFSFFSTDSLHAVWPFTAPQRPFSIMLDPAGDAKNTGRVIEDSFERGITLQFAEQLKHVLEQMHPGVRIVLTRFPGETLEHLQNANFANRLDVDLYVSIHFYHEKASKPTLSLYHFLYNPITDFWAKPRSLSFYPYDQAHLYALNKTVLWGEQVKTFLKADAFRNLFEVKGLYGIPLRPLVGIKAPALAIEAGIKNKGSWKMYVEPIAQSLVNLIREAAA